MTFTASRYDDGHTVDFIIKKIEDGLTQRDAAVLADISENTITDWKREHPEFARKIAKAKLKNKERMIGIWRRAADNNPTYAVTWLERRYSDEFGPRVKQDVTISEANKAQAEAVKKLVEGLNAQETAEGEGTVPPLLP